MPLAPRRSWLCCGLNFSGSKLRRRNQISHIASRILRWVFKQRVTHTAGAQPALPGKRLLTALGPVVDLQAVRQA